NAVNQKVQGAYGTMEGLASALGIDIQAVLQGAASRVADVGGGDGNATKSPQLPRASGETI
ncbi:MAG: hypothetical protein GWN85_23610, partial [Gemmatimonadetes bacterium]|nr:hypothetical protein [Gemmatimonadota bacterium]NIR38506.1 hypothetical protein [Actinomycetota bacterium]